MCCRLALCLMPALLSGAATTAFDGKAALAYTEKAVSFGERPAGSENLASCRKWIEDELKPLAGKLTVDSFTAETPDGAVPMQNLVYQFPGNSGKAIVISGHYDTKRIAGTHFVGANDGGSSTGFLLEMAHVLARQKHADDIYLVFFDGEEAVRQWSATDSLYGSRHLAAQWNAQGFFPKIRALINVDMIGDRDLDVLNDMNSSLALRKLVRGVAAKLGYAKHFRTEDSGAEDDHMPFVDGQVNAVDLLDLDYGPQASYWHTAQDTMDKLSAESFQIIGDVVLGTLQELESDTEKK